MTPNDQATPESAANSGLDEVSAEAVFEPDDVIDPDVTQPMQVIDSDLEEPIASDMGESTLGLPSAPPMEPRIDEADVVSPVADDEQAPVAPSVEPPAEQYPSAPPIEPPAEQAMSKSRHPEPDELVLTKADAAVLAEIDGVEAQESESEAAAAQSSDLPLADPVTDELPPSESVVEQAHDLPQVDAVDGQADDLPQVDAVDGQADDLPQVDAVDGQADDLSQVDAVVGQAHDLPQVDAVDGQADDLSQVDAVDGQAHELPQVDAVDGQAHDLPQVDAVDGQAHELPPIEPPAEQAMSKSRPPAAQIEGADMAEPGLTAPAIVVPPPAPPAVTASKGKLGLGAGVKDRFKSPAKPATEKRPKQVEPVRPAPVAATAKGPRKARLRLMQIDPWSVLKTSFLLSVALGVASIVAMGLLYTLLSLTGVFDSLNNAAAPILGSGQNFAIQDYLSMSRVLGLTSLAAVLNAFLIPAISTLAAYLYNLAATLVGGVEVTLAEDN